MARLALGVKKLSCIIELDGIIMASIMGLDVMDIMEGDIVSDMGLVIDIIGLVDIMGLVDDMADIMGFTEAMVDIMGLVDAMDIIGLEDIMGFVDIIGDIMDIMRLEFITFSASFDIMDRTVRIMGDVVIICVITGMDVPVIMASWAASLRRGVVEPLIMALVGFIVPVISAEGDAIALAIAFAIALVAILLLIEEAGIIESCIAMVGSDAIIELPIGDDIWERFSK